nr:MAG TPA: hypothetical protein [Crassvirales sp.]
MNNYIIFAFRSTERLELRQFINKIIKILLCVELIINYISINIY